MDWGTRRKPLGAIVAWSSLALFAVLGLMGIAALVMNLQPNPAPRAAFQVVAATPEERLPQELSFADAQAAAVEPAVADAGPSQQAAPVTELQVAARRDDMIASTFDQLVRQVVVPAETVPEGAVATIGTAKAAATAVASASVDLPMGRDGSARLAGRTQVAPSRNAAAWAIESEVPDRRGGTGSALGYAAQPADDEIRVGEDSIFVRSGPSLKNKRLFSLEAGAEVDVTGKADGWVSITDADGRDGWVDASLLDNLDLGDVPVARNVPAAAPETSDKLKTVGGSGVTVRAGPGKSNRQLFSLATGSEVTVLDDSRGWLKIRDAKGRTGWAYRNYLK